MIACTSEQALWCGTKREKPSVLQESIFLTMAILLAYASQFVDDARINHIVIDGDPTGIHHDIIDKEPSFFNMATCHSYSRVKTSNYIYRNFYNLLKSKEFFEAVAYCLAHGIMEYWNVGMMI